MSIEHSWSQRPVTTVLRTQHRLQSGGKRIHGGKGIDQVSTNDQVKGPLQQLIIWFCRPVESAATSGSTRREDEWEIQLRVDLQQRQPWSRVGRFSAAMDESRRDASALDE